MRCCNKFGVLWVFFFIGIAISCNHKEPKLSDVNSSIVDPSEIPVATSELISGILEYIHSNQQLADVDQLGCFPMLNAIYTDRKFAPLWFDSLNFEPEAEKFIGYLKNAAYDGLFRTDYHYDSILSIRNKLSDSINALDVGLRARFDLYMTDGLIHVIQDLNQGRLQSDSASMYFDVTDYKPFFEKRIHDVFNGIEIDSVFAHLHPDIREYDSLHMLMKDFVDHMDRKEYTYLKFPYKKGSLKDSVDFIQLFIRRISEEGIPTASKSLDSAQLSALVKSVQQKKKLKETGIINSTLVNALNLTDRYKFNRLAVTLDRYKSLPRPMPDQYIMVNLPGYYLNVRDSDSIALTSKIIIGKPATATPFITSAVSNMVTLPTWTIPASIIEKEVLPAQKKDRGYLERKGYALYDKNGDWVNPDTVNWQKYQKGIPYRVVQGSGEDNALGVFKFNFYNPFDVYLHDTNQRYLFKRTMRALSHGCVRVEEWQKLAEYIALNDSMKLKPTDSLSYNWDSISTWITNGENHIVRLKSRIPLFIRYFSCNASNGKIYFYDDIYQNDKRLIEKYFSTRKLTLD